MAFKYRARSADVVEKRATQQGGEFSSFIRDEYRTYTPKKGDNAVRILPPTYGDGDVHYGLDVHVHYSVGPDKASVLCPYRMAEQACPICEERVRAERRGDEDEAKDLKPARRVVVWMIDRKDEAQGVLAWAMAWTVDRDISKVCKDRETGVYYNIDDPDAGFDIYFDRDGEGLTTKYSGFQLARRASSVDAKMMDFAVANPLPEILLIRTYDEIKALYEGAKPAEKEAEPAKPITRATLVPRDAPRDREEEAEDKGPPFDTEDAKAPEKTRDPEPVSGSGRAASLRERFASRG